MKIAVLGTGKQAEAWKAKNLNANSYAWVQDTQSHADFDVFVDLDFDENPTNLLSYSTNTETVFLVSAVNISLEGAFAEYKIKPALNKIIGINALPTMVERTMLEYTNPFDIEIPSDLFETLGYTSSTKVDSRVGMVTPRIICMIINEAFYTVQEGTADAKDIDTAMKLGTNYPKGPFEFLELMGIKNVYNTLNAVYHDTHEERYKVCPLLKKGFLRRD
jgi:3-hydroxybutyryl-CoA dehydrogenase